FTYSPIDPFTIMTRIGLLSDTHNFLDEAVFRHFEACDEIWHAGDFGTAAIAEQLAAFKPLRGVYGNIDGRDVRALYPEKLRWHCENVPVLMIHIGGYPGRYTAAAKAELRSQKTGLFISGHSHILKIQYDPAVECLHINPGAAGRQGWHKVRTLVRFVVEDATIRDCEVIELNR
ncbi:MAG TPA: metallophosphoesterase family protein, partial [Chitinophagaceae bacterium]|nr:metallophosphoesterase family protein [Chitinophagaceae bacterium]